MADYSSQFTIARLWKILVVGMIVMFGVLLYFGNQIYHLAPPIPSAVKSDGGVTLFTREQIERGQNVWQSMGGMQQGSIWGHGSYVAPDWSADWLHREARALLDGIAMRERGVDYEALSAADKAQAQTLLKQDMRTNTYDATSKVVTVSNDRAEAIAVVGAHYSDLFQGNSAEALALREQYAFPVHAMLTADESAALNAFFFWTAWAATTERPGKSITYTSNWPHEPLVGNTPTGAVFMWTIISIFFLLGGIGALVWYYAREFDVWRRDSEPETGFARNDFMDAATVTPSMRAASGFFVVAILLFVVQVMLGIVTAHYAVEGQGLYGLPLSDLFPYSVTRTWHTQLAVLWIATAWLGTGLYVAPLLGGREPRFQAVGVWFLLVSLVVIVVGSFAGQWLAINRMIPDADAEFLVRPPGLRVRGPRPLLADLPVRRPAAVGRARAARPVAGAEAAADAARSLFLVVVAAVAIGLLFGAGLLYGQHTHISIMEYWRWWVVHLWVEGVFEVFATAIVSALLVRMGLVRVSVATTSVLFATIIFLGGGVLGTFHHLYWSGTPIGVLALGSVFSALEVVPLMVVGFEAYSRAKHEGLFDWQKSYYWPFRFFIAVLVWNLIGAGLFGFLINPPLALYYMQGLNTTADSRPRGAVRCLRHAGPRSHALLHARADRPDAVEQPAAVRSASGASTSAWP